MNFRDLINAPLPLLTAGCIFLSVVCAYLLMHWIYDLVEEEDRTYMDPLPPLLKFFWPLIQIIAHFVCGMFVPYEYLEMTEKKLVHTGVSYLLTAEEFVALRIVSAIAFPIGAAIVMSMMKDPMPLLYIIAPILGFFFPDIWLADTRKKRELGVVRAMPVYLDFITMCVEAGLNLTSALGQAMEKAPAGPLKNEFGIVLRDLRSGVSRADSLKRMAERLQIPEVTSFISSMVQAEKMGASLVTVLKVQSEQRRNERFQRAEKMAMEAPVKLIAPLIIFIFPVTFIVLGFPIVMKFIGEGTF